MTHYPEFEVVQKRAREECPRFSSGFYLAQLDAIVRNRGYDWCTAVLSHAWQGLRCTPTTEAHMLAVANEMGLNPPLPPAIVAERESARRRAEEWELFKQQVRERDAERWAEAKQASPVRDLLAVHANTGGQRLVGGYNDGPLRHAVPAADVYSGRAGDRARRHPAGRALCETATRAKPLRLTETPDDRPATCVNCIKLAPAARCEP